MNFREMAFNKKRERAKAEGTYQPRPRRSRDIAKLARERFSPDADVNDHDPFSHWNDAQPHDPVRSEEFRREWENARKELDQMLEREENAPPPRETERRGDPDDPLADPDNAIAFAVDLGDEYAVDFLRAWRDRNLGEWGPLFADFVDNGPDPSPW